MGFEFWGLLPMCGICSAVFVIVIVMLVYFTTKPFADLSRFPSEHFFLISMKNEKLPVPSLYDSGTIDLSVIVPAYEEEVRLPPMLDECLDYLENRQVKYCGSIINEVVKNLL